MATTKWDVLHEDEHMSVRKSPSGIVVVEHNSPGGLIQHTRIYPDGRVGQSFETSSRKAWEKAREDAKV